MALIAVLGALVIAPVMASVMIISRYVHAKLLERDPWDDETDQETPTTPTECQLEKEGCKKCRWSKIKSEWEGEAQIAKLFPKRYGFLWIRKFKS